MRPTFILVLVLLILPGCSLRWTIAKAGAGANPYQEAIECDRLDRKQLGWNIGATVSTALAGATGIVTVSEADHPIVNYTMGGLAIGLTTFSSISAMLAAYYTQKFCRKCANLVPPTETLP